MLYIIVMLILFVSCNKEQPSNSCNLVFSLEISDVTNYSADITISHTGTNRDHYIGFYVKGLVDDVDTKVDEYILENGGQELYSNSLSQRKKVVHISPLSSSQDYTYIVFGISEDGEVYGEPGIVVFSTESSNFVVNPNWSLVYNGEVFHDNAYWSGISLYISGEPNERCLVWILSEDECEGKEDSSELIYAALNSYKSNNQDMSEDDMWADNDWIVSKSSNFYFKRIPGNYIIIAIGINADGTLTGHYARTESFLIDEYTPNKTYTQYYGDWILSDSLGVSYNVTITEYSADMIPAVAL